MRPSGLSVAALTPASLPVATYHSQMGYRFFLLGAAFALALFALLLRWPLGVGATGGPAVISAKAAVADASEQTVDRLERLQVPALSVDGAANVAGRSEALDPFVGRVVGNGGLGRIRLNLQGTPPSSGKSPRRWGTVLLSRDGLGLVDMEALGDDGRIDFEGLVAGTYSVEARAHERFRFAPVVITLTEGESVERDVDAEFRRPVEFKLTATRLEGESASSRSRLSLSCDARAIPISRVLPARFERSSARRLRMGVETSIVLDIFSGPLVWEGSFRGRRGRPVVPAMTTRTEVMVPYPTAADVDLLGDKIVLIRGGRRKTETSVDVALVFGDRSQTVSVKGVIANEASERAGGVEIEGASVTGEAFAEALTVREDGGFFFSAELDRLSGPQVYLRSKVHQDRLGPFVLVLGQNDLGKLKFRSRLTQAEVTDSKETLRELAKLPPSARGRLPGSSSFGK